MISHIRWTTKLKQKPSPLKVYPVDGDKTRPNHLKSLPTLEQPGGMLWDHAQSSALLMLGSPKKNTREAQEALRVLGAKARAHITSSSYAGVQLCFEQFPESWSKASGSKKEAFGAFLEGFSLQGEAVSSWKSKTQPQKTLLVGTSSNKEDEDLLETLIKRVTALTSGVQLTRAWSNAPSNIGTPSYYAKASQALAKAHKWKIKILSEKELRQERMELFLGVAKGSTEAPKLVVLEYRHPKAKKHLALVGKGVTFDTGGISIKPSMRMEDMKHDMTGAATIMGALLSASSLKVPLRLTAFLAFTENMPDGQATVPGSILKGRSGTSVEIINTDAEGRLILADVLDYAQSFKPDALVDLATLTGAVTIALGKHAGAVLGNDRSLVQSLLAAGERTSERLWELPIFKEVTQEIQSDMADIKNSCNDAGAGTIRGAAFLNAFVRPNTPWAHLDIAGTAYHMGHLAYAPKRGAAGTYVRLLLDWMQAFK
jgi:leucyl aminopeptidase